MWLITEYEAVTLFSLKISSATSSGGKSLLVPTPYAIKMALLDVACRLLGVREAEQRWPEMRNLQIAFSPAPRVVVTNLFQKVLRPRRQAALPGDQDSGPFQRTIGYREYVQLVGPLGLAVGWTGEDQKSWLAQLFPEINYFGKRGSFVQLYDLPKWVRELPAGFVDTTQEQDQFILHGTLQVLDDCSPGLTFDRANIYNQHKVRPDAIRITRHIVLPYRLTRSSKSFSLYERIDLNLAPG
ncbi:MAG: hypothetical protein A2W36_02410 [Chloroflexi bacterium RBG_16_58_14]|nr:MAG: hypothetical protein A2W36_02410 [Chloroflexi bacterium RBG_16_58_14]